MALNEVPVRVISNTPLDRVNVGCALEMEARQIVLGRRQWLVVRILSAVILTVSLAAAHAQQPADDSNVLVLLENNLDSPFSVDLQRALLSRVQTADADLTLFQIPYDYDYLRQKFDPSVGERLLAQLQSRFELMHGTRLEDFTEIIAYGNAAAHFLEDYAPRFATAELSFFGINWQPTVGARYGGAVSGADTLSAIATVFPDTEHVVLYIAQAMGTSLEFDPISLDFEVAWQQSFRDVFSFESRNTLAALEDTRQHLAALEGTSVAIYIDSHSVHPAAPAFDSWIREQSRMPVFGVYGHQIDDFTGGNVLIPDRVAELIVAKAEGVSREATPIATSEIQINHAALSRWRIARKDLPDDVVIRNMPKPEGPGLVQILGILAGFAGIALVYTQVRSRISSLEKLRLAREHATEMTHLAEERQQISDALRAVIHTSQIGQWEWHIQDDVFSIDPVSAKMLNVPDAESLSENLALPAWRDVVKPEDLPTVENFLHCIKAGMPHNDLVFRVLQPDGSELTLEIIDSWPEHDEFGNAVKLRGLTQDVTERETLRATVESESAALAELTQHASETAAAANRALELARLGFSNGILSRGPWSDQKKPVVFWADPRWPT